MSGARPGTKSQLNESVDIRCPGAPETGSKWRLSKRMPDRRARELHSPQLLQEA